MWSSQTDPYLSEERDKEQKIGQLFFTEQLISAPKQTSGQMSADHRQVQMCLGAWKNCG